MQTLERTFQCPSRNTEWNEIPLTQGKTAIVDADDYEWLMQWTWWAHQPTPKYWRAMGWVDGRKMRMSRVITAAPKGYVVDHIDGNSLNNRRSNLRICKQYQNSLNSKPRKGTSKYKGVSYSKSYGNKDAHGNRKVYTKKKPWAVYLKHRGHNMYLGCYATEKEAAIAYDTKVRELGGDFAYCNFPPVGEKQT